MAVLLVGSPRRSDGVAGVLRLLSSLLDRWFALPWRAGRSFEAARRPNEVPKGEPAKVHTSTLSLTSHRVVAAMQSVFCYIILASVFEAQQVLNIYF